MKRILLLATGGTIASKECGGGLSPTLVSRDITDYLQENGTGLGLDCSVDCEDILNLDSSNIQPEEWQFIARKAYMALPAYDGVIITHGTDTMAYTAAALSFMLRNVHKSVVLTGSQLPINAPLTDAKTNLYTAMSAVEHGITGVTVAFDRKIINGARAVKISTMGFDAFESVNAPYMGRIMADGMRVNSRKTVDFDPVLPPALYDSLCTDVFLLKLIPGTKPEIFDALAAWGYKGIVIEAFGSGGMHYLNRDLLEKLRLMREKNIAVVVCSQCLYEKSDLSVYAVGRKILDNGVIPGLDMTTEAAVAKLMWALGQEGIDGPEAVAEVFSKNIAGEVDAPR
ncbi:MAG: asparaginase [Clostridiales bacterium]|jgi:L-asparaginase|nr:asparaginase [Clostridiales bacterium]